MEENRNLAVCHDSIDFLRLPQHRVCYFLAAGSVYSLPWESCIFWLQYARWIDDARWKSEKCVTKRLKIQHLVVLKPSLEFLPLSLGNYFAIWLAHFFFFKWVGSTTNKWSAWKAEPQILVGLVHSYDVTKVGQQGRGGRKNGPKKTRNKFLVLNFETRIVTFDRFPSIFLTWNLSSRG